LNFNPMFTMFAREMHMNKHLLCTVLCWLAYDANQSLAGATAAPASAKSDENTVFLAHFDGNVSGEGLAADISRGRADSVVSTDCSLSDKTEGRFGSSLKITEKSYLEYDLGKLDLQSLSISFWFRMDTDGAVWAKADTAGREYKIFRLSTKNGQEYVSAEFRRRTLFVRYVSQEKEEYLVPAWFRANGRWLTGSEHYMTLTFDGARSETNCTLNVYIDDRPVKQKDGLLPMQGTEFTLSIGRQVPHQTERFRTMAGLIDELHISDCVRPHADLSRPEWRGFLPGCYNRCRTDLPLEIYFSKALDPAFGAPVALIDRTTGKRVGLNGQFVGNGSVYKIDCDPPLAFEHEFSLEFQTGEKRPRDRSGNPASIENIPVQGFSTRKEGETPRPLPLKFRNDNTHVTVEGMEQMCANGMDAIEFNMVQIKDGWIPNHMRRAKKGDKTYLAVIPARDGDQEGFDGIESPCQETDYATYAAVDYIDSKDGKIDPIPRCEDLYKIIKKWDKTVHLQVICYEGNDFLGYLGKIGFDWSRFHSWHGKGPSGLPEDRLSTYALSYPYKPEKGGDGVWHFRESQARWPGYVSPAWVDQAKEHGYTVWQYGGTVQRAARLGFDFSMDNDLAYEGNKRSREILYKLHQYEGATTPVINAVAVKDRPLEQVVLAGDEVVSISFDVAMEARSLNYNSVCLLREGDENKQKIPLRIDADSDFRVFSVSAREKLREGDYVLTIGNGKEPISIAGLVLAKSTSIGMGVKPQNRK